MPDHGDHVARLVRREAGGHDAVGRKSSSPR
jgi:hypothetical protein